MRALLTLLAASLLAAAVPAPVITRPSTRTLRYDVHAVDPWMPLLWEDLLVSLPGGPCGIRITAELYDPGDGYGISNADLLTLRSGHGVLLDDLGLHVDGLAGTWSGLVSGAGQLSATLPAGAQARHVLLLLRQIHVGHFSGAASNVARRARFRLEQTVDGATQQSAAMAVNFTLQDSESLPLLRFDPVDLTVGVASDLRPVAWYDSRPATPLSWLLLTTPGLPGEIHIVDGTVDVTRALTVKPAGADGYPMSDFSSRRLSLTSDRADVSRLGFRVCNRNGTTLETIDTILSLTTSGAATGGLVIGDLPLSVVPSVPSTVELRTSLGGTWACAIESHSNTEDAPPVDWFTLSQQADGVMTLTIDARNTTARMLTGILVLSNGGSTARIPFRIISDPGTGG